jgi:signal peptidase II
MTRADAVRALRSGPYARLGVTIAAIVFAADQLTKLLVLHALKLELGERYTVTPFLDFVLTYNRGISYGLLPQEGELGRWALVVLSLAAAALFAVWMIRAQSWIVAVSLGLLVGGAVGNALDRMVYGAVADFVSLHGFGWYWYVFNLADAAIVAGVVGLLYDAFTGSVTKSPPSGRS